MREFSALFLNVCENFGKEILRDEVNCHGETEETSGRTTAWRM